MPLDSAAACSLRKFHHDGSAGQLHRATARFDDDQADYEILPRAATRRDITA